MYLFFILVVLALSSSSLVIYLKHNTYVIYTKLAMYLMKTINLIGWFDNIVKI